jgi:tetratricopeptide (TPR) repeat protein
MGQAELHWGLRRLFALLATFRPVTIMIEDLHWAEPTLLELLRFISSDDTPILVLCTARPELLETAPEFAEAGTLVRLDALERADSERLLRTLLAGTDVPPATVERLLENAAGNPLFLEETARMLESAGGVLDAAALPTSLRSLIGSRLDQLPREEKQVAQTASVVGAVFWPGAVERIAELHTSVVPCVRELERRDLVREQGESTVATELEYAFKHILIRDVAYERLPKGKRAVLHHRFAGWVSDLPGYDDDFVEFVAYHLEQSCRLAREVVQSPITPPIAEAVTALTRAAEKAERREGLREAERYYVRATEIATDADVVLDLDLRRGRTLAALGDLRGAEQLLAQVEGGAAARELDHVRCEALVALANIEHKRGAASRARAHLDEALRLAAKLGDERLHVRATFESSQVRAELEGESDAAVADLRHALVLADALGERGLRTEGRLRLGSVLVNMCRLREAETEFTTCAALASELGSHRDEARAQTLLALVEYYRGDLEQAERRALEAFEWLERIGDRFFQLQNAWLLGRLAIERGEALLAEERLRVALPQALESGGWLPLVIYHHLALALLLQERLDDARDLIAFAAKSVEPEDVFGRSTVLLAQAELATSEGDADTALRLFGEAIELLVEQRVEIDLAEGRLARARAVRRLGDGAAAADELAAVRQIFDGMEALRLVREIDDELAELAGEAGAAGPARR